MQNDKEHLKEYAKAKEEKLNAHMKFHEEINAEVVAIRKLKEKAIELSDKRISLMVERTTALRELTPLKHKLLTEKIVTEKLKQLNYLIRSYTTLAKLPTKYIKKQFTPHITGILGKINKILDELKETT